MPVDRPHAAPIDLGDGPDDGMLDATLQPLQLLQPQRQASIVEPDIATVDETIGVVEEGAAGIGQRRPDLDSHTADRTHVPIKTAGCHSHPEGRR
jgi:hypothetical protein